MLPKDALEDTCFKALVSSFKKMCYRYPTKKHILQITDVDFDHQALTFMRSEVLIRKKFQELVGRALGSLMAKEFMRENRVDISSMRLTYGEGQDAKVR